MLMDVKPGWGPANFDWAQQGGSASGCRLQVLVEPVHFPHSRAGLKGQQLTLTCSSPDGIVEHRRARPSIQRLPKTLVSCQLTSHWPKQATWPSSRSRGEKQSIRHDSMARMWTYTTAREEWGMQPVTQLRLHKTCTRNTHAHVQFYLSLHNDILGQGASCNNDNLSWGLGRSKN